MKISTYAFVALLGASQLLACGGASGQADDESSAGGATNVSGSGGAATGGAGTGGVGTGGASTGGGATLDCSPISPCGGDLVGRWRVVDYCPPTVSSVPECNGLITDESVLSDFFYVFESDGVLQMEGTPLVSIDQSATDACAKAAGFSDVEAYCADASEPRDTDPPVTTTFSVSDVRCNCHLEVQAPATPPGVFSVSDGVLSMGTEDEPAVIVGPYCVTGDSLRIATSEYGTAILLVRE